MIGINTEYPDSESPDPLIGVLVRDEPDEEEEEDEEEDEGNGKEDGDDDEDDDGYSRERNRGEPYFFGPLTQNAPQKIPESLLLEPRNPSRIAGLRSPKISDLLTKNQLF
jgi:hypothetical protein